MYENNIEIEKIAVLSTEQLPNDLGSYLGSSTQYLIIWEQINAKTNNMY